MESTAALHQTCGKWMQLWFVIGLALPQKAIEMKLISRMAYASCMSIVENMVFLQRTGRFTPTNATWVRSYLSELSHVMSCWFWMLSHVKKVMFTQYWTPFECIELVVFNVLTFPGAIPCRSPCLVAEALTVIRQFQDQLHPEGTVGRDISWKLQLLMLTKGIN